VVAALISDVYSYFSAIFWTVAGLVWSFELALSIVGFVIKKKEYLAVSDWLDQWIEEDRRVAVFRFVLVVTFIIAGFQAWQSTKQTADKFQSQLKQSEDKEKIRPATALAPQDIIKIHEFFRSTQLSYGKIVRPCTVRITASEGNGPLRDLLVQLIAHAESSWISGECNIYDPAEDAMRPYFSTTRGIVVHWNPATQPSGQAAVNLFYDAGYEVAPSNVMFSNAPPELFWIEIGSGSPWRE
jgi:hypothetical protein